MSDERTLGKRIASSVGMFALKRSIRSHKDLLRELSQATLPRWKIGALNFELKKRYGSVENALYHRNLLGNGLITFDKRGNYSLTSYAYSLLMQSSLDELVDQRGFEELDLAILLELLNTKTGNCAFALRPPNIASRLNVSLNRIYKSGSRLSASGLIESEKTIELPKTSQRIYKLTDRGKVVCQDAICSTIAHRIALDYEPPKWVSIAELMNRRFKYPKNVQTLIERSFAELTRIKPEPHDLCNITFNMFPWLEQITTDHVIENYMKDNLRQKEESSGFKIDREFTFTGGATISSFAKRGGTRVILFALESLHLPEAKPIIGGSLLLGGMEGPMAYCVLGVGKKYKKAFYEEETVFSKKLVRDVAEKQGIRDSQVLAISGKHSEYLRAVDREGSEDAVFHVKSPFAAIMQTQFHNVQILSRIPIVLGVFVSAEDQVGINAGIELAKILRSATKTLGEPRIYAEAVLDYVHKLPKIDSSFNQVHLISEIQRCGVNTHAEFD